jgi:hypothetical protein
MSFCRLRAEASAFIPTQSGIHEWRMHHLLTLAVNTWVEQTSRTKYLQLRVFHKWNRVCRSHRYLTVKFAKLWKQRTSHSAFQTRRSMVLQRKYVDKWRMSVRRTTASKLLQRAFKKPKKKKKHQKKKSKNIFLAWRDYTRLRLLRGEFADVRHACLVQWLIRSRKKKVRENAIMAKFAIRWRWKTQRQALEKDKMAQQLEQLMIYFGFHLIRECMDVVTGLHPIMRASTATFLRRVYLCMEPPKPTTDFVGWTRMIQQCSKCLRSHEFNRLAHRVLRQDQKLHYLISFLEVVEPLLQATERFAKKLDVIHTRCAIFFPHRLNAFVTAMFSKRFAVDKEFTMKWQRRTGVPRCLFVNKYEDASAIVKIWLYTANKKQHVNILKMLGAIKL